MVGVELACMNEETGASIIHVSTLALFSANRAIYCARLTSALYVMTLILLLRT